MAVYLDFLAISDLRFFVQKEILLMISTPSQSFSRAGMNMPRVLVLLGALLWFAAVGQPVGADEATDNGQAKKLTLGDIIDRSAESVVLISTQAADGAEI